MDKNHQKHTKLPRPAGGDWGPSELAFLGAPCGLIRELANKLVAHFAGKWNLGFVDAEHNPQPKAELSSASVHLNYRSNQAQLDLAMPVNRYRQRALFSSCDLVLINGNHARAAQQIVIIHPNKSLEKKTDQLSDVKLVLLADGSNNIPEYLQPFVGNAPQISLSDEAAIFGFFRNYLDQQTAKLNGLVLIGGKSVRMGTDKSLLNYHGSSQRELVMQLLQPVCETAFLSCNFRQSPEIGLPKIEDRYLGIGPMGGILSAFQSAPDKAWLTVACDMPHLSSDMLRYLITHRNPSKLATAFANADEGFPEPLLTIWEPRAYPVLLLALSQGVSCPRKVLLNSEIELITPPDPDGLKNINDPEAQQQALHQIKQQHPNQDPAERFHKATKRP